MTSADKYFLGLYQKAYSKIGEWQRKMDKREFGSPEWQIARHYRDHYSDLCIWLDQNSPTRTGFHFMNRVDTSDEAP
jgi:hypothetical protein